jgi:multiple sugar transport system substrate-binding protein
MRKTIDRRELLKTSAAGAAAFGVSAAFGSAGLQAAAAQADAGQIVLPHSGVELPTDDVQFRWIDSGDLKALFYRELFKAYQEKYPNITISYDALPWTEINRIVPLGVQNGEAHDIFAMPQDVVASQAVAEGWVAPLDDLIPNFEEWKARFPLGSFLDGVHVFDGKTYTFPQMSSKRYWTMNFYNSDLLEKAGYDPANERMTWD